MESFVNSFSVFTGTMKDLLCDVSSTGKDREERAQLMVEELEKIHEATDHVRSNTNSLAKASGNIQMKFENWVVQESKFGLVVRALLTFLLRPAYNPHWGTGEISCPDSGTYWFPCRSRWELEEETWVWRSGEEKAGLEEATPKSTPYHPGTGEAIQVTPEERRKLLAWIYNSTTPPTLWMLENSYIRGCQFWRLWVLEKRLIYIYLYLYI